MTSLYVTVTEDSEFVADIFPRNVVWELVDEQVNDDLSSVLVFSWNGEKQNEIEQSLSARNDVTGYQII